MSSEIMPVSTAIPFSINAFLKVQKMCTKDNIGLINDVQPFALLAFFVRHFALFQYAMKASGKNAKGRFSKASGVNGGFQSYKMFYKLPPVERISTLLYSAVCAILRDNQKCMY
jgi:hypothetical protein